MYLDVLRRTMLTLAALAVVLLTDCAFHTEGATLALFAARSSANVEVLDGLGRPVEIVALELALRAELVECTASVPRHARSVTERRVRFVLGHLGVSRAYAHDGAHDGEPEWPGVTLDAQALTEVPSPIHRVPATPGRYCDLRLEFGAEDVAEPTLMLRVRSADGAERALTTTARRAILLPLDSPVELDARSPAVDVLLLLDAQSVVSRVDLEHLDPEADAVRAFSDLVERVEARGLPPSL